MTKGKEMTREEARQRAEVMMAYANGMPIQILGWDGVWYDLEGEKINFDYTDYRVKPEETNEPIYREFDTIEEVEPYFMKKICNPHIKSVITGACIDDGYLYIYYASKKMFAGFLFKFFTFEDGTPCGVKVSD